MNSKRLTRLLKLLQMLESGPGQTSAGLAEACGVGRRTIFRDLEALRQAGVPLAFDLRARRFSISGAFFLPPTNFTTEEALSLLALADELGRSHSFPFHEAVFTAALKLEANLPPSIRQELRQLTQAVRVRLQQATRLDGQASVYQQLLDSIATRRVAHIEYDSLTEWESIATKLRPYQLLFSRRSWYVIGRSSLHREVRIFSLSRITSLRQTSQRYTTPKNFDLDKYLGNAWQLIRAPGRDNHVTIRFQPLVARNVAEVLWHKTQRTKTLADGSLEFSVTVSGLNEIAWWVLGYGDQAEVLKPASLRRLIARRAQNMVAMYNGRR